MELPAKVAVSEPDLDNALPVLPFTHFSQTWKGMDPASDILVERERRREAERLLSREKEQNEILRSQLDKFRRLLSEAEAKNLQEKLAYLDLENKYERERMMRINRVGWYTFFHTKTHWADF